MFDNLKVAYIFTYAMSVQWVNYTNGVEYSGCFTTGIRSCSISSSCCAIAGKTVTYSEITNNTLGVLYDNEPKTITLNDKNANEKDFLLYKIKYPEFINKIENKLSGIPIVTILSILIVPAYIKHVENIKLDLSVIITHYLSFYGYI